MQTALPDLWIIALEKLLRGGIIKPERKHVEGIRCSISPKVTADSPPPVIREQVDLFVLPAGAIAPGQRALQSLVKCHWTHPVPPICSQVLLFLVVAFGTKQSVNIPQS